MKLRSAGLFTAAFALACGSGDDGPPPGDVETIVGLWAHQRDDDVWLVREISADPYSGARLYSEFAYLPGDTPVPRRTGQILLQEDVLLPGGELGEYMVVAYFADAGGYPFTGKGYDHLVSLNEKRLELRGLYDAESVVYDRVEVMP